MKRRIFTLATCLMVISIAILAFDAKIIEAQIIEDGLLIYYSYDADTVKGDTVIDLSGNGHDGLLKTNNLKVTKGKVGDAMEFPGGVPNYISVKKYQMTKPIDGLSLAAWIKTPMRGMIASWDRSEFFRFTAGDDFLGNLEFIAFDTCCGCCHDWHGQTKVTDDKWHHVAATFDGKEKRIYVDGKLDAKVNAPAKVIGAGAARFGFIGVGSEAGAFDGGVGPTFVFTGLMDEFVMYERGLSEKEYMQIFNAKGFSVEPEGKLAMSWGKIKALR